MAQWRVRAEGLFIAGARSRQPVVAGTHRFRSLLGSHMPKSERMREVFISWSGKRSLAAAESLCDFIPRIIPELENRLFLSTGIEKGARWSDEIARHLEEADAGILCLTAEG